MSDLETLAELVCEMRDAQKEFFRTRKNGYLYESKHFEKIVDKRIAEILDKQLKL